MTSFAELIRELEDDKTRLTSNYTIKSVERRQNTLVTAQDLNKNPARYTDIIETQSKYATEFPERGYKEAITIERSHVLIEGYDWQENSTRGHLAGNPAHITAFHPKTDLPMSVLLPIITACARLGIPVAGMS